MVVAVISSDSKVVSGKETNMSNEIDVNLQKLPCNFGAIAVQWMLTVDHLS